MAVKITEEMHSTFKTENKELSCCHSELVSESKRLKSENEKLKQKLERIKDYCKANKLSGWCDVEGIIEIIESEENK